MLNDFYSEKFDERIVLKNNSQTVCLGKLKKYIQKNIPILKTKQQNVVLPSNDILTFTVNFFASVFSGKNIYLIDDISRAKNLALDFDVLDRCCLDAENYSGKLPKIDEEKTFVNLLTSGSSGKPKCITKNLTNLIKEALDISKAFNINNKELIVASSTTCSHMFGLTFGFMFPICCRHIIYSDIIKYPDLYDIENSLFVSTPAFLDTVRKNNILLNGAKYIVSAGSKLRDETFEYLERFYNIIDIYGSTETGVIAYRTSSRDKELTLFENVKVTPLENSAIIKTPYAFGNETKIYDKILQSGNKIILQNRTDRLLKIQEKRISAEDMEHSLKQHDYVTDNYCFKSNDKIACICALSEKGKMFLLNNGIIELTKELKAHLKKNYEIIPQRWRFTDEVPQNKAGKIDKEFIEHLFEINLSFPVILERTAEADSINYKLFFHKNCSFYSGHFPGFPITPGVVQLYIAAFLGERYFQESISAGQIRKIKFSNIIHAGETVDLKLIHKNSSVSFEYFCEDKILSSGIFSCENVFKGVD